jgi:hypothetical protein
MSTVVEKKRKAPSEEGIPAASESEHVKSGLVSPKDLGLFANYARPSSSRVPQPAPQEAPKDGQRAPQKAAKDGPRAPQEAEKDGVVDDADFQPEEEDDDIYDQVPRLTVADLPPPGDIFNFLP